MNAFTKEDWSFFLSFLGLVITIAAAIPAFKGYYLGALTSNNSRKLKKLQDERAFFVRLHESKVDAAVYLVQGVLIVLAIVGVSMMFHAIPSPDRATFVALVDTISGFVIYTAAIWRLGKINRLAKFEHTLTVLDQQIGELERKLSANRSSAN
ncbi:hypothetical protein [Burkholderia sp. LMG 32019]|uniref:hypothetical protein n=1 Tax=Burkholderia sp. LMG 32019 TaxID=3158173 RepID=UPI003C2B2887